MESLKTDFLLDAKGLACPMPIVKTKKAMNNLESGQVLEVRQQIRGQKLIFRLGQKVQVISILGPSKREKS